MLTEIATIDELDVFLARPSPLLLYKHSLTCGTSAMAFEEIRDLADGSPHGVSIGVVKVQPARTVSNAIAARFGIRHESPQVLLVHDGRVVWHASHFRVTSEAIREATQRHGVVTS